MEFPILSKKGLKNINPHHNIKLPQEEIFSLPEKVLQFGTGVLLRGLPDYFIDKANKQGIFNGRIVIVKSTDSVNDDFANQDGLYVHNIKGLKDGKFVDDFILNASISRVISSKTGWKEVLECAANRELSVIISNTTEVGITLVKENIFETPPSSFPAKLTAFLYQRFKLFSGRPDSGLVIVPTELITDNGKKLKEIVITLSIHNNLEKEFILWLEQHNSFCNSLVDRIVPGMPNEEIRQEVYQKLGVKDNLLIASEPYKLWAIEGSEKVKEKLSFSDADSDVIIAKDITGFRERKLRILNGTHTIFVGLGFLSGLETVHECMNNSLMKEFIQNITQDEIVPSLELDRDYTEAFAKDVIERFANPSINHPLINITFQYTSKMNMRNAQTIINYYKKFNEAPRHFALGFAGYLLFMKPVKVEDGKYYGKKNGSFYPINDDKAEYYYEKWAAADVSTHNSSKKFVEDIIDDEQLWNKELKAVTGFPDLVASFLFELVTKGAVETLEEFVEFGEIEE